MASRAERLGWIWVSLGVLALAWAGIERFLPRSFEAAVHAVSDWTVDGDERARLLAQIRDGGLERSIELGSMDSATWAAASAILLGDEGTYRKILADLERVGLRCKFLPRHAEADLGAGDQSATDAADADRLAFRIPSVRELWLGHASDRRGDLETARFHFARARQSAQLSGLELVARLANARLGG